MAKQTTTEPTEGTGLIEGASTPVQTVETPTVKMGISTKEGTGHTLLDDALAAKPQREAEEAKAAATHKELEESGKLAGPQAPLIGYEEARAQLGQEPEKE